MRLLLIFFLLLAIFAIAWGDPLQQSVSKLDQQQEKGQKSLAINGGSTTSAAEIGGGQFGSNQQEESTLHRLKRHWGWWRRPWGWGRPWGRPWGGWGWRPYWGFG